jgi:hypothetical protein
LGEDFDGFGDLLLEGLVGSVAQENSNFGDQVHALLQPYFHCFGEIDEEMANNAGIGLKLAEFGSWQSGWIAEMRQFGQQFGEGHDDSWPEYTLDVHDVGFP